MTLKHPFSGKNLDEAIAEAAKHFGVDKAFVCYTLLKQQGGFLSKIFSSKVQIEAWVETAKEDLQEAARKAVREALGPTTNHKPRESTPRNTTTTAVEYKDAKIKPLLTKYNELFFSAFALSSENYTTEVSDNHILVHVSDEYLEDLLTKSDKLSLAYDHVFKRLAQKNFGDVSGRAFLNAGTSAEKREERLTGIAKSLAEKVRKTGRSVVLSSKSSQERRIIHLALDGCEGIATRSVGMGDKRRLVIFSTDKSAASTEQKSHTHASKKHPAHKRKAGKNSSHKKKNSLPSTKGKEIGNDEPV
ncbi:MAG: R3H domain-containing nucleic acid-binding protein [Bdellovibrionota bacterium]